MQGKGEGQIQLEMVYRSFLTLQPPDLSAAARGIVVVVVSPAVSSGDPRCVCTGFEMLSCASAILVHLQQSATRVAGPAAMIRPKCQVYSITC